MNRTAVYPLARSLACSGRASYVRPSRCAFVFAASPYRTLTTTSTSHKPLTSRGVDEAAAKGTEGLHFSDATAVKKQAVSPGTSNTPLTGDWVLFHPVYSQNELKAVEVRCNLILPRTD